MGVNTSRRYKGNWYKLLRLRSTILPTCAITTLVGHDPCEGPHAKRQIICRFFRILRKQNLFASDSPYASVPASSNDAAKISACSKGLIFSLRVNVLCLNPQCQTLTRRLVSTDTRLRTSRLARIQVLKSRRKASDFLSQRAHRLQSRSIRTSMTSCFLSSSSVACTSEATRSREGFYPQTRTRGTTGG